MECLLIESSRKDIFEPRTLTGRLKLFSWDQFKLSITCQKVEILDLRLRSDLRSPFYEQVQLPRRLL